jgi:hypothetical protein
VNGFPCRVKIAILTTLAKPLFYSPLKTFSSDSINPIIEIATITALLLVVISIIYKMIENVDMVGKKTTGVSKNEKQ